MNRANPQVEPELLHDDVPSYTAPQPQAETVRPQIKPGHMFQINFYSRFFDINTEEFFGKIRLALNPFNRESVASSDGDDHPELYGFIWINATLVFLMFVSATGSNLLAHFLHAGKKDKQYEYNFKLLTLSITLFYGYTIVVPLTLYVITKYLLHFKEQLSLTRLVSIYSYANVMWFPITVANFFLVVFVSNKKHSVVLNVLQWAIVLLSGAFSGLSIVLKVRPIILKNSLAAENPDEGQKQHLSLVLFLAGAHLIFTILVKMLFFGID